MMPVEMAGLMCDWCWDRLEVPEAQVVGRKIYCRDCLTRIWRFMMEKTPCR